MNYPDTGPRNAPARPGKPKVRPPAPLEVRSDNWVPCPHTATVDGICRLCGEVVCESAEERY